MPWLKWRPRLLLIAVTVTTLAAAGCGDRFYPVHGTVTLDDGSPVTRGMVICERIDGGDPVTAQGEIGPDGSYKLGTTLPGNGVPPGKYRVLINPMDLSDVPDEQKDLPFDAKYLNFKTSGLEMEVKRGDTEYPIKLTKSLRKRR